MTQNDVMEVSGENGDGPWTTRNEKIFIQLMDEEVKSNKSGETGTFTREAWKRIRSELIRLTGYSYTKEQVKNKYNALRMLFNKLHYSHPGCSGVSGSRSIGEVGIGPLTAGMKECQALLNTMDDLDEDSYNKVLEKLHGDVLWRQMFMDMSEKRRIAWIKKL
ncbi:hypothetical protein RHMOL_Rhmol01G0214100 [Rhododendron molle]|uniref:Uncharacterized protein n=1 Tax=Rhododendron molle TaxID=49168 RepID=A0ACC0Q5Y5_RHOML|nr:hypothetical protein RHMOL_Rhmol01G0214100 [Rhododendron molle]